MNGLYLTFVVLLLTITINGGLVEDTTAALTKLKNDRFLRGIALQITKQKEIVYNFNIGDKNSNN